MPIRFRTINRSRTAAIALSVAALTLVTACGGGDPRDPGSSQSGEAVTDGTWEDIVAAAKEEGQVSLYSHKSEEITDELAAAFEKAYPEIDLQYVQIGGAQPARIDEEEAAGNLGADIAFHGASPEWFTDGAAAGRFAELRGPASETWPAEDQVDGIVRINLEPWSLLYNTDLVDEAPTTWDELASDEYDGKVGLQDVVAPSVPQIFDLISKVAGGWEFWGAVGDINPVWYPTQVAIAQAVASGEIAWTPTNVAANAATLKESGAPIDFVVPEENGVAVHQGFAAVLTEARNPNAAQVLIDFMMGEEGQSILNENGLSVLPGVEGTLSIDPALFQYFDPSSYDAAATTAVMTENLGRG